MRSKSKPLHSPRPQGYGSQSHFPVWEIFVSVSQSSTDCDSIPKLMLPLQQHARSCSIHDYENTSETVWQQCWDSFPLDCSDLLSRRFHNGKKKTFLSWHSAFKHSDWKQTEEKKKKRFKGDPKICSSNLMIPQHTVNLNISIWPHITVEGQT